MNHHDNHCYIFIEALTDSKMARCPLAGIAYRSNNTLLHYAECQTGKPAEKFVMGWTNAISGLSILRDLIMMDRANFLKMRGKLTLILRIQYQDIRVAQQEN